MLLLKVKQFNCAIMLIGGCRIISNNLLTQLSKNFDGIKSHKFKKIVR